MNKQIHLLELAEQELHRVVCADGVEMVKRPGERV